MNAEILSIGTELLLGEIADTNASFLAGELAQIGVPVYWISQVGDNKGRVEEALRRGLARSTVILITGGLGPTDDDLTREAIAATVGERPVVDPELERVLRERFRGMNRPMPEKNLKQAWLIPSAEGIPNPLGTAPGWWVELEDKRYIGTMPGVPSEMQSMWTQEIRPRLEKMSARAFLATTIKTFGAGESAIEERLGELVQGANPSVATYAKRDGVYVRVAASGDSGESAQRLLEPVEAEVRKRLGAEAFGENDDSLASVVGTLLERSGGTVATAESLTGGLVCSYLTDVPGSSRTVLGGVVAYNEEVKTRFGVADEVIERHGVVSGEVAIALADAARREFGSTYGIGTTGAAGPEPHGGKQPGTAYVAVTDGDRKRMQEVTRRAPRETVKHFVALTAIDLLRRLLQGAE